VSVHNGIDTVAWVSLGLYTKTVGSSTYVDAHTQGQSSINSLFVSLGLVEIAAFTGKWHRWINVIGWPWRKIWKAWG